MENKKYIENIMRRLMRKYGDKLHTELEHANLTELFVAVLLSPQCTDKQVNKVTEQLFTRFKTFDDYADCNIKTLRKQLDGLNYYRTKAKNLKRSALMIVKDYNGEVPGRMNELMKLPGVGRKVANVIMNEGFGIDEGIAVDTHCATVSRRLGLSDKKDANKVEQDLLTMLPKKYWKVSSNLFIALGRDACTARNRKCEKCVLNDICPSSTVKKNHAASILSSE